MRVERYFGTEKMVWKHSAGRYLKRSVEGPSEEEEDMVVSDGATMEGKWKRRNWRETTGRERFLIVEKCGWRYSVPTLAGK